MATIAVALAFVFALCFATRAMDDRWKDPAKYRVGYMCVGLIVGALGYLITCAGFRMAGLPLDTGLFFVYMLSVYCITAIVGMLGMMCATWLQNKVLTVGPPI